MLKNNKTSLSTRVGAGVSEVFLKLNPRDLSSHYLVSVAPVTLEGPGTFCPPVNLSLPADLLPISVQVSLHIVFLNPLNTNNFNNSLMYLF